MPIFRYTFKKILVSPSTWVIFVLSTFILGLCWVLPVALTIPFLEINNSEITKEFVLSKFLYTWKLTTFTGFVGLMFIIFVGIKATQIFRDEIDDGTLLILVSKPISRNRIWAEKWLSFQATIISYTFLVIFFAGILLVIPGLSRPIVFLTFLPYMGILFGIVLLFDLIFSSIVLLLSLVINGKATVALAVGFAALMSIFSQVIEPIVDIPHDYFQLSHAAAVYQDVNKKVSSNDFDWFKEQIASKGNGYSNSIHEVIKDVYSKEGILGNPDMYPDFYDPEGEQTAVHAIITNGSHKGSYTSEQISLLTHINNISSVFRQWNQQSYEELMTGTRVGGGNNSGGIWTGLTSDFNYVDYNAFNVIEGMNVVVKKTVVDTFQKQISKKRIMRYLNIFYQFYYLWNGTWAANDLYVGEGSYVMLQDPYIISFNEIGDNQYKVDANSGKNKIINFPALVTVYVLLGLGLLTTSWYVFNRRDFA